MYIGKISVAIFLYFLPYISSKCNDTGKNIAFITEYVKWRKINYLIFFDNDIYSACNLKIIRDNLNTFTNKNIYFAALSTLKRTELTLNRTKEHTVVVTFLNLSFTSQDLLEQANKITKHGEKASWLLLATCHLPMNILDLLRHGNFGINGDIVVAFDTIVNGISNKASFLTNDSKFETNDGEAFLAFNSSSNITTINCTITCLRGLQSSNQDSYTLYQVYKIRKTLNTSLVVRPLGIWDSTSSTKNLKPFWYIDNRRNFHQFPIFVGHYDVASEGPLKEDDIDSNQKYFVNYFASFLNSSTSFFGYIKLGHRENGEWSDLLGAIFDETVDISGQGISKTNDRINDMSYSFDILKNSRNIYIEPEETETLSDIYLAPFDSRLIFCVIGTGIVLAVAMTVNNFAKTKFWPKEAAMQRRDFSESLVWSVGIFSQQGSIWKTRSLSEKIIVIVALFLTILIYNSFSAFITSVLSVQLSRIRSIGDLLKSDYKIGYAKESQDEDYLRSVNVSELKQIYLRGYLQNDISNISEGLTKVTTDQFALFASAQVARTVLWNMTKCKCKYDIDEIKIPYTREYMGFIMSKRSSLKRLINQSIIKMYETGIYKYIYSIIYPELIKCDKSKTFQSAGLADLSTAFFIVMFGWAASFGIMIGECLWKKRNKIYANLKKRISGDSDYFNGYGYIQGDIKIKNMNYYNMHPKFGGRNNLVLPPPGKNSKYFDYVN